MKGLGTSPGIGMGQVFIYREAEINISRKEISNVESEIDRLNKSIEKSIKDIDSLYNKALEKVGEEEAEIFISHKMILKDPEYIGPIKEKVISDKVNSEWAVTQVTDYYISLFEAIEDEYLRGRVEDIKDVSNRLLRALLNISSVDISIIDKNTIILAHDLTPSDTAQMDKDKVVGIVTEIGGKTSHTSIIARTMGIPAICGVNHITEIVKENDILIINGSTGEIIINPTEDEINHYKKVNENIDGFKLETEKARGQESISIDGCKVEIAGNIGSVKDLDLVIDNDGEGVGLFRTEFMYMQNNQAPSEEDQFKVYKTVAERLEGKPLIIRTLDVGGDKDISYLNFPKEMNPFLGYRAIRYCLINKEIFVTQLRAILRASAFGNIKIMLPMISSIEELRQCKKILEEVKDSLRVDNIPFNEDIEVGIMVEIPSVAIQSRQFAKEVDFFSIGTNDLIQYTLAVDRGNQEISHLYNQYHPAVLSLIKMTIDNGHKEGIKVGMCGEAAGDEKLIPILLAMGLDEFSVNASSILKARYLIINTSKKEVEEKLDDILNLSTAAEVERYIDRNIIAK